MRWIKWTAPDETEHWVNMATATDVAPIEGLVEGNEAFNVTFIGGEYVTLRGDMDLFMDKVNGVQR